MNLTIYVDVLFLLNMLIDYIILCSTALISGRECARARLIAASAAGALYSVVIFFPSLRLFNLLLIRMAAGGALLLIAFKFKNIYAYLKLALVYFIINAVYGGGMYAFYHFTALGSKMNSSNGVYYIDLPLWAVILLAFVFYFVIKLFAKISDGRNVKKQVRELDIYFGTGHARVSALFDTGNTLYDPISLLPVMLVETSALHGRLSETLLKNAESGMTDELPLMHSLYPELKLRVVPFKDVTGKKSFVYAFKPKKIVDLQKGTQTPLMLVGIIGTRLSADGSFNALLHSKT